MENEETEGIGNVSAFFMAPKTTRMFENDRNRKTATQNGQKPINRTKIRWENANRKLLSKPQNRIKTARKIGINRKTARKIEGNRKTASL